MFALNAVRRGRRGGRRGGGGGWCRRLFYAAARFHVYFPMGSLAILVAIGRVPAAIVNCLFGAIRTLECETLR